ncbi:hypothetical protein FRC02_002295 [Tulasnella sp. 418]|nr:hypothetical protein FRC02_002295 [Tulasnella sp. 418]
MLTPTTLGPFLHPSPFTLTKIYIVSELLSAMQGSIASSSNGVEGYMEEWLNNEWPWHPGRPSVQSSVFLVSSSVQPTHQSNLCSYNYQSNHPSNQQWPTIEQPSQSPTVQYQPPTRVSSGPLVHHSVPLLLAPPAPAERLLTVHDRDISGSPTMVSRSPVPASQSPPLLPATFVHTNASPPPFKLPPQKGRRYWACPECNKVFNRFSACNQHRRRHTGEKPHRCETCNVGFAARSNLKRHLGSRKCRQNGNQLEARSPHEFHPSSTYSSDYSHEQSR